MDCNFSEVYTFTGTTSTNSYPRAPAARCRGRRKKVEQTFDKLVFVLETEEGPNNYYEHTIKSFGVYTPRINRSQKVISLATRCKSLAPTPSSLNWDN